jgi:hypothetical protein
MIVEPMMMMMMILVHGYEQDDEFPVLYANPKLHYHVHNISATRPQFICINSAINPYILVHKFAV